MTLPERVRAGLAACDVAPDARVLVAASGGVDSTVLLRTLVGLGQPVVAAHVDHRLRDESADDGVFVAALAERLGVPVERLTVEVAPGNVQAEARRARYAALADAARRHACGAVATGHTASDQAETVLAALARGAGLRGLAGMPRSRALASGVRLVRPLLDVSRAEVDAEARQTGWAWREDPSNETDIYGRNWLRHHVMPLLAEAMGEGVDQRIAASADAARSALALVGRQRDAASDGAGRLRLDALADLAAPVRLAVLAEAAADWAPEATRSRALVERLASLVDAEVGERVEAAGLRVWRERDVLRFETDATPGLQGTLDVVALDGVPTTFGADPFEETVDADRAAGAVEVRAWREGDRIRPLGLNGSQLVSDLLRDRGVPRADRPRVPVVLVEGEVAWVVGHRLAATVAVGPETRRAARWAWRRAPEAG